MPLLRDAVDERSIEMARLYVNEHLTMREIGDLYGVTRERVRQLLAPFELEVHRGAHKREQHKTRLREAFARIAAGKSTTQDEAALLGYCSPKSLRTAFWKLGLKCERPGPPPHGTLWRYTRYKCRCAKCRKAARDAHATMVARGPTIHGTASAYRNYGCRCADCRAGERRYQRERIAKQRQRKEPVT